MTDHTATNGNAATSYEAQVSPWWETQEERLISLCEGAKSGKWVSHTEPVPDCSNEAERRIDGKPYLIGNMSPATFHKLPKWLAAIPIEELSFGAKLVYAYLWTLTEQNNRKGEGEHVYPNKRGWPKPWGVP